MTGGGRGKAGLAGTAGGAAGAGAAGGLAGIGNGNGNGGDGGVAGAGISCTATVTSRTGCDDTHVGSHNVTNKATCRKTAPSREMMTPRRCGREKTPRRGAASSVVGSPMTGTGKRGATYFSRNPANLRHRVLTLYASHVSICL